MYQLDSFLSYHSPPSVCIWAKLLRKASWTATDSKDNFNHHLHTFPRSFSVLTEELLLLLEYTLLSHVTAPRATGYFLFLFCWGVFLFCSGFFEIGFAGELTCRLMTLMTAAWPDRALIHTNLVYFFFFCSLTAVRLSPWIINQFAADKKFISLFKIGVFFFFLRPYCGVSV